MIDRQQIIDSNPIAEKVQSYGISLIKAGVELKGLCPFHNEKTPSFHVRPEKQTFHCFGCGVGGSVIDFVSKKENLTIKQTMEKLGEKSNEKPSKHGKIVAKYEYRNEQGEILYKVFRFHPKTFRQAHQVNGETIWSMDGVRRVLYRLPEIIKGDHVIVCEGEKDADRLVSLGFNATCNSGGASKWLDGYTESLRGKSVTIIPDNDEAGLKHCDKIKESLQGKVKGLKIVKIPSPYKDVSEWADKEPALDHKKLIEGWIASSNAVGFDMPIYSMVELEERYKEFVNKIDKVTLNFDWLPTLKNNVRGLVPGEVMAILADTGAGKTALIQNIAYHARPLKCLLFEMELADQLIFERFSQIRYKISGDQVEQGYKNGMTLGADEKTSHIFTCPLSNQTVESIEKFIIQSELKIGERPQVVIVDYVGLVNAQGTSRYERLSKIAEDLKKLAKSSGTIIIIASQVHRKDEDNKEIYLHDAKDSGSIENSAGLVLGAWRETKENMMLKILKNTKGTSGLKISCNFNGELMTITETIAETKMIKI